MNQPHDLNPTTDLPSVPHDSLDAVDAFRTTDDIRSSASTDGSHPGADAPANDLPAAPGYRVLSEIARGGMGRVLAAHDLTLDRDVALKILLPGANADRFVRESKITARLPHPGIPPVHALGTLADGSPFLAMKLIAGQTLAGAMKTADRPRLLQAFTQVCQAVGFAHSRGVLHRDLKPANVMVGAFGEVQVMDWGLAKEMWIGNCGLQIEEDSVNPQSEIRNPKSEEHTQSGTILGTPAYMAPEQARGETTDARADVFALGGILCAILTGQPPFIGKSARDVIRRVAAADLGEANARLDGCGADAELIALCRRCLSPRPADRPADGQAVADGLTAYLHGVQERLQAAERERAVAVAREAEQRKRRRVQLALAAAVAVILLGGGAFAWYSDRQTSERRAEARNREQQANQGVDAALKLVPDLRKQYKFAAARKTLDQSAILAMGGAPDRLAEVEQARHDLEFVIRLDDIRYRKWIWITGEDGKSKFNLKIAAPEYRQAFAQRDLDLTALDPAEAANRIAASAVKADLVAAVDDWALHEPEPGVRDRLLDIARRADPDSWTDRLRDPAVRKDRGALEKLAAVAEPARTSSATLSVLAELMRNSGLNSAPLLTAARTASPADFELAFALGQWHGGRRDDQAIGPYEAARALRPENFAVWINLGNALQGKGQVDEAIACFRQACALDPKGHVALGAILCDVKRDYDGAIVCFRQAIALNPKDARAHTGLGVALKAKGKVDEAIACYQKAIALDPKRAQAHANLGGELLGQGKVDEAIACFRQAIALDPKHVMAHCNLGVALGRKSQMDEAIACYQKALALDPKDAETQCNLGDALARQGRFAESLAAYQRGHELGTMQPGWHYPSAAWVRQAEQKAAMEAKLPALLKGEFQPDENKERLDLANICQIKKLHHTATGLYAAAFTADPKLADFLPAQHRCNAARSAALAAAGQGEDAAKLDDKERTRLRQQALDWLQADLALRTKQLETGKPADRAAVQQALRHWQKDTDLADIRDAAAIDKLPAEEQKAFTQLWADVAELLKKAEAPTESRK